LEVLYDVRGWCGQDSDQPSNLIYKCLRNSGLKFIKGAFTKLEKESSAGVSSDLVVRMKSLQEEMKSLNTRFVRCIKPSPRLTHRTFSKGFVASQVSGLGLADMVSMQQGGYPIRLTYKEFWNQYHVLDPKSRVDDAPGLVKALEAMLPEISSTREARTGHPLGSLAVGAIRLGKYTGSKKVTKHGPLSTLALKRA